MLYRPTVTQGLSDTGQTIVVLTQANEATTN